MYVWNKIQKEELGFIIQTKATQLSPSRDLKLSVPASQQVWHNLKLKKKYYIRYLKSLLIFDSRFKMAESGSDLFTRN